MCKTEWGGIVPSEKLLQEGIYVRKFVTIVEGGKSVWTYDGIQFRLGCLLCVWVKRDSGEESLKHGVQLHAAIGFDLAQSYGLADVPYPDQL